MPDCPECRQRLTRVKIDEGIFFHCRQCDGRAFGLSVLRRVIAPECVRELWRKAREEKGSRGKRCPICRRAMVEVPVPLKQRSVPLDVCAGCQFVWFDPREFEQFPGQPGTGRPRRDLPQRAREAMATADLRRDELRRRGGDFGGGQPPDETWKWIPALFGMPVEKEVSPVRCWPCVTWGLAGVLVLVFLMTFGNLGLVVNEYGLVPAEAFRHGGITFITSFLLHAGLFHLIGNVYFLLIFGDNVEDHLGLLRYGLLIVAAGLLGDALHILGDARSVVPCIGASGGISGVITFYALKFPRARLGFLLRYFFYFHWLHIPAWFALICWFLLQLFLASRQLAGVGTVSALAHLGGAGVGVCAWLMWRESGKIGDEESFAALRRDPRRRP